MILVDDDGIFRFGVLVESVGKQNPSAEVHVATPESAELFATEPLELEPFCRGLLLCNNHRILRRSFNGRNDLVERELDGILRLGIEVDLLRLAVGIAGLQVPVLTFAFVGREPDGFAGC